MLVHFFVHALY